jgi:hypothetical protein
MTDEDDSENPNPPDELRGYRQARWTKHFDEIDREIAQLASVCRISILDPGVIERVLKKDTLVCGSQNPRAFDKLRSLLMMHYSVRDRAVVALGEQETMLMMNDIVERLRSRYGDRLGRPAG